jgi:hypothetical protein
MLPDTLATELDHTPQLCWPSLTRFLERELYLYTQGFEDRLAQADPDEDFFQVEAYRRGFADAARTTASTTQELG